MRRLLTAILIVSAAPAFAAGDALHPRQVEWHFDGITGRFDKPAIQRGFQVYKEVCSTCHSVNRVALRSFEGAGFSPAEVKSLAASYSVVDGPDDNGEMFERPGRPSDRIPAPYANEQAARAINNGAYPLDLSLIVKARHDGANYVYSLLTGYTQAPAYSCERVDEDGACVKFHRISPQDAEAKLAERKEREAAAAEAAKAAPAPEEGEDAAEEPVRTAEEGDLYFCSDIVTSEEEADGGRVVVETCTEMGKTMHYNPYFANKQIAMIAPLHVEGQVEYQDGTEATVEQMSHDVVNFLQWAAEPEMEDRKRMGIRVMLFLAAFTVLFYLAKKRIWSRIGH